MAHTTADPIINLSQLPMPGTGLDFAATNDALLDAYRSILAPEAWAPLAGVAGLSGIFLPGAPPDFCRHPFRLLIVGRAPKRWLEPLDLVTTSATTYVHRSTAAHLKLLQDKKVGRVRFLQFMKRANTLSGGPQGTLAWCNLFAVSHNKASPTSIARTLPDVYQAIKRLSRELLDAQLRVLRPHAICFTTNASFDKQLKTYFGERIGPVVHENNGARQRFELDGIPSWRIDHPMQLARVDRETALADMIEAARSVAMSRSAHP